MFWVPPPASYRPQRPIYRARSPQRSYFSFIPYGLHAAGFSLRIFPHCSIASMQKACPWCLGVLSYWGLLRQPIFPSLRRRRFSSILARIFGAGSFWLNLRRRLWMKSAFPSGWKLVYPSSFTCFTISQTGMRNLRACGVFSRVSNHAFAGRRIRPDKEASLTSLKVLKQWSKILTNLAKSIPFIHWPFCCILSGKKVQWKGPRIE